MSLNLFFASYSSLLSSPSLPILSPFPPPPLPLSPQHPYNYNTNYKHIHLSKCQYMYLQSTSALSIYNFYTIFFFNDFFLYFLFLYLLLCRGVQLLCNNYIPSSCYCSNDNNSTILFTSCNVRHLVSHHSIVFFVNV